jgi:RHS repeat-associated protein
MVGSIRSRFARLSVFSAIALGLLQVPPVLAAESLCKHNSPTSNVECKPRDSKPWVYEAEGIVPPVTGKASFAEALAEAFVRVPNAHGNSFCYYDHQINSPPWVVTIAEPDYSKREKKSNYVTGWVIAGINCGSAFGTNISVSRARTHFCANNWWETADGLGGPHCIRDKQSPPRRCEPPCGTGAPAKGGVGASEFGYMGNPIFVHNGDKLQSELDWSSGGHKPLVLARNYLSTSFTRLTRTPYRHFGLGAYWRTSFDLRLDTYVGATVTTKISNRPDGSTRYFYQDGTSWTKRAEESESLVNILDAGGAVVGWRLTLSDNRQEEYDLQGRAIAILDASGWRQDIAYNASDLVATVTDSAGRQIAFSYDADGWLTSISTPDGVLQYTIDVYGYLAAVAYPDGAQRDYMYMEPAHVGSMTRTGLLTGIIDENGDRFATFKYDSAGFAWSTEHGNGANKYTSAVGASTVVTDPLGTVRTVTKSVVKGFTRSTGLSAACPTCGPDANISASTLDANGNVTSRTFFTGKKSCYAYDTARNLENARLEGATSAENCTTVLETPPNRPDVRKVTTNWHATWRLPATIIEPAPGGTKTTTFTHDASGNLTQKTIAAPKNDGSGATITRTWSWTYGTLGRVLTATDPNGKVTTTTWHSDTDPDLGKRGQVATVTDPLGHMSQYTAYDAGNRLTSMTDPNGLVSAMDYDLRGRLISRSVGGETTIYDYDLAGLLTDVELPDGATLHYVYDTAHRSTEVHDGLGNKVVYTLDGMGNRTAEQAFDPSGVLARTRTRVYDSLNRLSQEVGALGQATVHTYDGNGNRLTTTDPLSNATTNTYDALNRLLTVTQPGGPLTRYAYDKANNLVTVTDPRNLVTTYGYDGLDNQVSLVSPDTGTTTRTFDAAGNVLTSTDARGVLSTYAYDNANRVTQVAYSKSGFPTETHAYTWDAGPNAKGRISQVTDPSGTTAWTFAPQGRVASRAQTAGGVTLTTSYAWANGRLAGMITPSGQQLAYTWTNGRINAISLNGGPLVSAGDYEPFGPVAVWQWANGHKTYRDHDQDGRLSSWEYRNGTSILRRNLTWDHANRITAISDPASAANSSTYGYDVLDRLTSALSGGTPATSRGYGYDAIGNRTTSTVDAASTTYAYPPTSHRLTSLTGATTKSYTYDGAGNPTQAGLLTYGYNLANRMASVSGGASATYQINALGQRVAKTIGTTTTRYVYDEQGRLIGEYDQVGNLIQETVWLDDLPIATLRPTETGNPTPIAIYYVHADYLGSPRAITRPSDDQVVWRWDNDDPFGNNAANENPGGLGNFRYDLRFPGQQYDAETGAHYNYFRDYEPTIGRYLQSDPIGLGGGLSTYGYASFDPLRNLDPFGEQAIVFLPPIFSIGGPLGAIAGIGLSYILLEACRESKEERCRREWEDARERCRKLFTRPGPPPGLTGGYSNIEDCARGFVTEDCGGNPVDWGRRGRRPR